MSCVSCTSAWTTSAIFHSYRLRRATVAGGDARSTAVYSATIIGDLQSASLPARRHRRPLRRSGGCTANATFGPFGGAGNADTWSQDANGTYDIGPLQFTTAYLASLRRFGITPRAVEGNTCYSWFLAAWRIHNQLVDEHGGFWTRVVRYHSATPRYIGAYRQQLFEYAAHWSAWLIAHYPTVVFPPGLQPAPSPAHQVPRERPAIASLAERPTSRPTPRRTIAPAGLQMLRDMRSSLNRFSRAPGATPRAIDWAGCQSVSNDTQAIDCTRH